MKNNTIEENDDHYHNLHSDIDEYKTESRDSVEVLTNDRGLPVSITVSRASETLPTASVGTGF